MPRFVLAFGFCLGTALSLSAQSTSTQYTEKARQFLIAAYPELSSRSVLASVTTEKYAAASVLPLNALLTMRVVENQRGIVSQAVDILTVKLLFDERGYLVSAHSSGTFVNSERRLRLDRIAALSPSAENVRQALTAESAALIPTDSDGPTRVLMQAVQRLAPFLGPVSIDSVRFTTTADSDLPKGTTSARVAWLVSAVPEQGPGVQPAYWLMYEPHDGLLVDVVRRRAE